MNSSWIKNLELEPRETEKPIPFIEATTAAKEAAEAMKLFTRELIKLTAIPKEFMRE